MSNPKYATIVAALLASLAGGAAQAQSLASSMDIYVYPAQNQDAAKQSEDDYACVGWAKQQSGYDPINPPQATAQVPKEGRSGARLRGAARGATAGAVVSEITDNDTSDAMAAGAVLGMMRGGRQVRMRQQEQAQQAEAAAAQQQNTRADGFKSAYAACMEARGYSVK